jgi:hypothetical protein
VDGGKLLGSSVIQLFAPYLAIDYTSLQQLTIQQSPDFLSESDLISHQFTTHSQLLSRIVNGGELLHHSLITATNLTPTMPWCRLIA